MKLCLDTPDTPDTLYALNERANKTEFKVYVFKFNFLKMFVGSFEPKWDWNRSSALLFRGFHHINDMKVYQWQAVNANSHQKLEQCKK